MKFPLKRILQASIPFLIGAAILWWMYRGMSWADLEALLTQGIHWDWMGVSLLAGLLPCVLRGLRWRMALSPLGEHPSRRVCIDACFLSYAASLVIPRIGEVTRCGTLKTYAGTSFTHALGTVVTERIVDSLMLLLISLCSFASQLPQLVRFILATGTTPHALLSRFTATGYWVTLLCGLLIVAVAAFILRRMRFFQHSHKYLSDLWAGIVSLRKVRQLGLYLLLSLGIWGAYFLHFYLAFWAFDFTAGFNAWAALMIFCIGSFAVIVPTPNGAGPWHFACKTMLVIYGVAEQPAVLFALTVHTIQTALVAVLGGAAALDLSLAGAVQGNPATAHTTPSAHE